MKLGSFIWDSTARFRKVSCITLTFLASSSLASSQTFDNPLRIPTAGDPAMVMVADINHDGIPDILYGNVNTSPEEIDVLLGQSGGGYVQGNAVVLPQSAGAIVCRTTDANRDGNIDLVCLRLLDIYDAQITTFLGNGNGTFQPGFTSATLSDPNGFYAPWLPALADVNADGIPDLLVPVYDESFTGNGSTIFVLLGDGSGNFSLSQSLAILSGPEVWNFTTADVNGDGKVDLLEPIGPWVFLGNGDGTFQYGQPQAAFDSCIFQDMDGDGHLDAACGALLTTQGTTGGGDSSGATEFAILHGNPNGTFTNTPIYTKIFGNPNGGYGAFLYPERLADVNGDGIPDLLGFSKDGLAVLPGTTGISFGNPSHFSVGYLGAEYETSTIYADMNGDGILDVVSTGPNGIYISYGKGDGTFAAPASVTVAQVVDHATVADFNGDGIPDIAATGDGNIEVSLGRGDGTFMPYTSSPSGTVQLSGNVEHGDFLGNGKQGLLAFGAVSADPYNLGLYLMESNGDGTFAAPQLLASPPVPSFTRLPLEVADLNGDGREDIAYLESDFASDADFTQWIVAGISNGDGTFTTVQSSLPGATPGGAAQSLAFADFNGDGKLDLAYGASSTLFVIGGNGDGSFSAAATVLSIPEVQGRYPSSIESVATADFDGDGKSDIAVLVGLDAGQLSAVVVYYGNGNGTFSAPAVAATFGRLYNHLYATDVDQDGHPDLILQIEGVAGAYIEVMGDAIGVVKYQADRLFGPEESYTGGEQITYPLLISDLNRDGYPDIVAVNSSIFTNSYNTLSGNSVTPLLNRGKQIPSSGRATTTSLSSSTANAIAESSVTFTATISTLATGEPIPTGNVRFVDQTGVAVSVALTPVNATTATAGFTVNSLGIGQDTMGAFYSGDSVFAPSSSTVTESISGYPAVVTVVPPPNPVFMQDPVTFTINVANPSGSAVALPTGYVILSDGSSPIAGPLSGQPASPTVSFSVPGVHHCAVWYSGDTIHNSATATLDVAVLAIPTVQVSYSAPYIIVNQGVTAQVSVQFPNGPVPTGSVSLAGSGYTSPAVPLVNGMANFNIPANTFAAGSDTLTASYTPDAASVSTYFPATGSQFINVVLPPPFSLTGNPITVTAGSTPGISTITVTPANNFTGSVQLTAAITSFPVNLRYSPTFSLSGNPVTITGAAAGQAILKVFTNGSGSAAIRTPAPGPFRWPLAGGTTFACVLLICCPVRRRILRSVLGTFAATTLLIFWINACGGGVGPQSNGTLSSVATPGTYVITITGTSGQLTSSTTITVAVQ
jgi:hypothetical protein